MGKNEKQHVFSRKTHVFFVVLGFTESVMRERNPPRIQTMGNFSNGTTVMVTTEVKLGSSTNGHGHHLSDISDIVHHFINIHHG